MEGLLKIMYFLCFPHPIFTTDLQDTLGSYNISIVEVGNGNTLENSLRIARIARPGTYTVMMMWE